MKRRQWALITVMALFAASAMVIPRSAPAQGSLLKVSYRNLAMQCVWVTLYRRVDANLIKPSGWEIVKGGGLEPQMVRPYKSVEGTIDKPRGIRMRNQIMYTCSGGGGHATHDTHFTEDPLSNVGFAEFTLHQNMHRNSYYISGSFH